MLAAMRSRMIKFMNCCAMRMNRDGADSSSSLFFPFLANRCAASAALKPWVRSVSTAMPNSASAHEVSCLALTSIRET